MQVVAGKPARGEVIASNTRRFVAEVPRDAEPPGFGRWVIVERRDGTALFGLVSHIEIGSVLSNRQATALGRSREELMREMPQVLALLRSSFEAQVLAYRTAKGVLRQTLPPQPADLHDMVRLATPAEVQSLSKPYDYLRTLVRNPDPEVPADDLLVAALRALYLAHDEGPDGRRLLHEAGRVLTRLLNDDHERLQSILRRVV